MIRQRKLLGIFYMIYAECQEELFEIDNKANIKPSLTTIIPSVDINSFYIPSETKDGPFRMEKEGDPVMAEELIEKTQSNEKREIESQDDTLESKAPETKIENINVEPVIVENAKSSENVQKKEMKGMSQMATCTPGQNPNCAECCAIFTDNARRAAFGYQLESVACQCHDICVEDVRDICVKRRTIRQPIPCNPDASAGCRGGFLSDGPPTVQSTRVLCAEERLSPETNCDRIINEVEFEVVLRYASGTLVVVTPRDTFDCRFFDFARFPSGTFFPNTTTGLNQFRNELALIDGSCKVIIIESVRVVVEGNDCILVIDYKVIDKLWKHENLLVSALKPYGDNITVKQEFGQGHAIGPCANGVLVADLED